MKISPVVLALSCFLVLFSVSTGVAEDPTVEVLSPFAPPSPDDSIVSSDGTLVAFHKASGVLSLGTINNGAGATVTRSLTLASEVAAALSGQSLSTSFVLRSDGRALIAPVALTSHALCPYYIVDTNNGSIVSGTYLGIQRTYSRGIVGTDCHQGLSVNSYAEQFALIPSLGNRDVFLIGYDGVRTVLTPLLSDDATIENRVVFLSANVLVAQYSLNASSPVTQKFISFDRISGDQSEIVISDNSQYFSLIKARDSQTLLLHSAPEKDYIISSFNAVVQFDVNTKVFSSVRDDGFGGVGPKPWLIRDRIYESSLGNSVVFRQSDCSYDNGGPPFQSSDICLSSGSRTKTLPLQCYFPNSGFSSGGKTPLGVSGDRSIVYRSGDALTQVTFPAASSDLWSNYCSDIQLLDRSSCARVLKPILNSNVQKFPKGGLKRSCTMKFQVRSNGFSVGHGIPVRLLKRNTGKYLLVDSQKTDKKGIVFFTLYPNDFAPLNGISTRAVFKFAGNDSLRPSEYVIAAR